MYNSLSSFTGAFTIYTCLTTTWDFFMVYIVVDICCSMFFAYINMQQQLYPISFKKVMKLLKDNKFIQNEYQNYYELDKTLKQLQIDPKDLWVKFLVEPNKKIIEEFNKGQELNMVFEDLLKIQMNSNDDNEMIKICQQKLQIQKNNKNNYQKLSKQKEYFDALNIIKFFMREAQKNTNKFATIFKIIFHVINIQMCLTFLYGRTHHRNIDYDIFQSTFIHDLFQWFGSLSTLIIIGYIYNFLVDVFQNVVIKYICLNKVSQMLYRDKTDYKNKDIRDLFLIDHTDTLTLKTIGKLHKILINHWQFSTYMLSCFIFTFFSFTLCVAQSATSGRYDAASTAQKQFALICWIDIFIILQIATAALNDTFRQQLISLERTQQEVSEIASLSSYYFSSQKIKCKNSKKKLQYTINKFNNIIKNDTKLKQNQEKSIIFIDKQLKNALITLKYMILELEHDQHYNQIKIFGIPITYDFLKQAVVLIIGSIPTGLYSYYISIYQD